MTKDLEQLLFEKHILMLKKTMSEDNRGLQSRSAMKNDRDQRHEKLDRTRP